MNCRIVLVRPEVAANLGATARAMRNFGLSDLVLVSPAVASQSDDGGSIGIHGQCNHGDV